MSFRMILIMNRPGAMSMRWTRPTARRCSVQVWTRFFRHPYQRAVPVSEEALHTKKKVTSPRTEDHHLGALFDACGPGTSPRVSPRVSPRPSLDGDDDEQALFDAIIVDDESSPRASPRTSPMPSPRLPPPTQSTTPHLASSGFNFDALPAPGEGKPVTGEVGPPPVPTRREVRGGAHDVDRVVIAVRRPVLGRPGRGTRRLLVMTTLPICFALLRPPVASRQRLTQQQELLAVQCKR